MNQLKLLKSMTIHKNIRYKKEMNFKLGDDVNSLGNSQRVLNKLIQPFNS